MCSAPKNSYLSRRIYSDTSAELVEARVSLTSFKHIQTVTTTPEQQCIRAAKDPTLNTKSNYEKYRSKYEQSTMSQDLCQNFG